MSRVILPQTLTGRKTLIMHIIAKDNVDKDVLKDFLIENDLVLADLLDLTNAAIHDDDDAKSLGRMSEENTQMRDRQLRIPFDNLPKVAQFLKGFYRKDFKKLGEWGITITNSGRINYPADIERRMQLVEAINTKHISLGAGSPLVHFLAENSIDLAADVQAISKARNLDGDAKQQAINAEEKTQQCDEKVAIIDKALQDIADFLRKYYTNSDRKMGEFGFTVDNSTTKPKERTTTLKPLEKITTKSVHIGTTLFNLSAKPIHVYKGSTTTGNPTIVEGLGKMGMVKGYSTITVSNPSEFATVKFKVTVSK